jgi:hypothetical protein
MTLILPFPSHSTPSSLVGRNVVRKLNDDDDDDEAEEEEQDDWDDDVSECKRDV